jgi:hypothetical protein
MSLFVGRAPVSIPGGPVYTPPDVGGGDSGSAPDVTVESAATTFTGLQSDINAAPDGSVIGLVAASTLTGGASDQIRLVARHGIQLVMRGATLHRTAAGTIPIIQADGGGSNFGIFNGILNGSKSSTLGKWNVTYEHEHGIQLGGIVNAEFSNVQITNVGGDGLNLLGSVGADSWSKNVRFHHGVLYNCGRMGVSITDGARSVVIDFNTISEIGYYTFDVEPNGFTIEGIAAGALDVRYSDNTIGTKPYGDHVADATQAVGYLLVLTNSSGAGPANRIQLLRNTMSDQWMRVLAVSGIAAQDVAVQFNTAATNFVTSADVPKCVQMTNVANVVVTNNTQPCTVDADFISTTSCTGTITTTPNTI